MSEERALAGLRDPEVVARGLERLFRERPRQQQWADLALVLSRTQAG